MINMSFYNLFQDIHYFAGVDMSAFYLDIIKDRLYTEGTNSIERRSAQTVMTEILVTLTKMIGLNNPIYLQLKKFGKLYQKY